MESLGAFLHQYPELCLFLSIVLGHIIGGFHYKGVGFGWVDEAERLAPQPVVAGEAAPR